LGFRVQGFGFRSATAGKSPQTGVRRRYSPGAHGRFKDVYFGPETPSCLAASPARAKSCSSRVNWPSHQPLT